MQAFLYAQYVNCTTEFEY